MGMGMEVRKGAKVSYKGSCGETIVGVVVGFGGICNDTPLVMALGEFVKSWMHDGNAFKLYETVGGMQVDLPVVGEVYYYVREGSLKVLGYE